MSLEFVGKGEYKTINGVELYVYDSAEHAEYQSPVSLVFLHGIPGQISNWKYQVPFFEKHYRVVVYDQRGYGRSEKPEKVSMDDYVSDLGALLEELGIDDRDAVLIGHCFGGMIAQIYASQHEVKGVVLVSSLTKLELDITDFFMKATPAFVWKRLFFSLNPLTRFFYGKLFISPKSSIKVIEEIFEDNAEYFKELPPKVYKYGWYLVDYDTSGCLPKIKSPTLVIVGEDDAVTPPSVSERVHKLIPNSKLVIIKEAGHLVTYEKPDELNNTILDFIKSLG